MKEKTKPYIRYTEKTLPGSSKSYRHILSVEVEGHAVTFSKRKGRRTGFASVLSVDGKTTEHYAISGFWLATVKAIIEQSRREFFNQARGHFKPTRRVVDEDADGNPLEVVQCSVCSTQFWTDGETPCPGCNSMDVRCVDAGQVKSRFSFDRRPVEVKHRVKIESSEDVPSFEDFLTKGGRIEYEPPKATNPFGQEGRLTDEDNGVPCEDCEDCEDCGDCKEDEEHLDIIKRMNLSFASPLSGALRPEAPATQNEVFELAEALSKELQTMTNAFARATEKVKKR